MKIVILLFASLLGFGFAVQEAVSVEPKEILIASAETSATVLEEPVMDVVLDTVEISVMAPAVLALN
ncbi:MAG: hypothetical protein LPK14_08945 [Hymenobacteraceae bacterium]|nr:hypothetical protein [Hymenobacteraceae bacterium]